MPVITNLHPVLSIDYLLQHLGQSAERPEVKNLVPWAIDEAQRLACPALVYEWFPVQVGQGGTVQIVDTILHLGSHADLFALAREALVGVFTIGKALDEQVRKLADESRFLESYLLDTAGILALGAVEPVTHIAEKEAARRSWGVSCYLSPGSLAGWTISDQKALCALLDLPSIGVSVTAAGLLAPQKSGSVLIGIGPDYTAHCVTSTCHLCEIRHTCQFRH